MSLHSTPLNDLKNDNLYLFEQFSQNGLVRMHEDTVSVFFQKGSKNWMMYECVCVCVYVWAEVWHYGIMLVVSVSSAYGNLCY